MSTKIYGAFRVPASAFTTVFLPAYREHCFRTVARTVRKLAGGKAAEDVRKVFLRAKKASATKFRDDIDASFDCSLNVWLHGRYAYAILYGEWWIHEKFEAVPPVEDFRYWNNTDKPDDVTERAWAARAKAWEAVCLDDFDRDRLVHTIIDVDSNIGVREVARRVVAAKDIHRATWLFSEMETE